MTHIDQHIITITGVEVNFSELNTFGSESDGIINVSVQTSGRQATDVTVIVTTLKYDDIFGLGMQLPVELTNSNLSSVYSRATGGMC